MATTTLRQPLPTTLGSPAPSTARPRARGAPYPSSPCRRGPAALRSVTLVPAGGLKANCAASGRLKSTELKATSKAGSVEPLAKTCTRSGTCCSPSMASRTDADQRGRLLGREHQLVGRAAGHPGGAAGRHGGGRADRLERQVGGLLRRGRQAGRALAGRHGRASGGGQREVRGGLVLAGPQPHVRAVVDDVGLARRAEQGDAGSGRDRRTRRRSVWVPETREVRSELPDPGAGAADPARQLAGRPEVGALDHGAGQTVEAGVLHVDQQLGRRCAAAAGCRRWAAMTPDAPAPPTTAATATPGTAHRRAGCVLKMLMGSSCVTRTERALRTSAGVPRP